MSHIITPRIIHVSPLGEDDAAGLQDTPLKTISRAASIAREGDTIVIHNGTYRESISPLRGGSSDTCRITYAAAPAEHPVIKGSEVVDKWEDAGNGVWRAEVPNTLFGNFNPFSHKLYGDWLEEPSTWQLSLGEVYINGKSMYEAATIDDVRNARERTTGVGPDWASVTEKIEHPEDTIYQWYAEVHADTTEIWANFHDFDPHKELIEINVRQTCFYPQQRGINYITLRGLEFAQAACPWAPPTGNQIGMVGPHWSKGWIIEDCNLHDAKCSAISLGKDELGGDNEATRLGKKPGYQTQLEIAFAAEKQGWSYQFVGSHVVRNNKLHDCGQNGVVGNLGCINSTIIDNEIYNIGVKHEYFGHEIAGIKLHASIDVIIEHNHIHDCTLGTWLDWEAQGTRVSRNVYDSNVRDFMIEVTSGPCLIDNNIFGSAYNVDNVAQGTAFVHNLFCGSFNRRDVLNRATPYHFPHSTAISGYAMVYGGDDRFVQNIFVGGNSDHPNLTWGTSSYDDSPTTEAEYDERVHAQGVGDLELFENIPQPSFIDGNVYLGGAGAFTEEVHNSIDSTDPEASVDTDSLTGSTWLDISIPQGALDVATSTIASHDLEAPRLVNQLFEARDGSSITFDSDISGTPRETSPTPGPIEQLHDGNNRIQLF